MKNQEVEAYLREQIGVNSPQEWINKAYPLDETMTRTFVSLVEESDAIFIMGDYDTDGVFATKILDNGLRTLYPNKTISALLPDRFRDGYGMNNNQIDKIVNVLHQLRDRGITFLHPCIITCDNGTCCNEVIDYAKEQIPGLRVIVTDHHLPRTKMNEATGQKELDLPNADLICNPHIGGFAYENYCGAGVALRMMECLLARNHAVSEEKCRLLHEDLVQYAGIATVGDMVDMKEDNWVITRQSLDIMRARIQNRNITPALQMIFDSIGIEHPSQINEGTYAYTISPLINAMGRLQDYGAQRMFRFLNSRHPSQDECDFIIDNNQTRKVIVKDVVERLMQRNSVQRNDGHSPIWVYIPETEAGAEEGLCGLYAIELAKRKNVPVIVVTPSRVNPSILKGSGRGIPGFDLYRYLEEVASPYLLGFGGHYGACGLSCDMQGLRALSRDNRLYDMTPYFDAQAEMDVPVFADSIANMIDDFVEMKQKYAPFGTTYEEPQYVLTLDSEEQEFGTMGEGAHFFAKVPIYPDDTRARTKTIRAIHFHHDEQELTNPEHFQLIGHISENYYNGYVNYQFLGTSVQDDVRERTLEQEPEAERD